MQIGVIGRPGRVGGTPGRGTPWWALADHLLDGAVPTIFTDPLNGRAALSGASVPLGTIAPRTGGVKYVVNSAGALVAVGANEIAIDYSNGVAEMLLEGQSTNICTLSNTISSWSIHGGDTSTSCAKNEIGPDGSLSGWTVNNPNGAQTNPLFGYFLMMAASSSTVYTLSVWAKAGTSSKLYLAATNLSNDTVKSGSTVFNLTTEWARYSIQVDSGSTGLRFSISNYAQSGSIIVFGAQAEAASVPSSYIPTSGSAVVRSADLCQLHSAASACTAWAWRGSMPTNISNGQMLGFPSGKWGISQNSASEIQIAAWNGSSSCPSGSGGSIRSAIGAVFGSGESGTITSLSGSTGPGERSFAWASFGPPASAYIGPSTGLAAGQILRVRQLVAWTLPDRPSAAGVQAQARLAT